MTVPTSDNNKSICKLLDFKIQIVIEVSSNCMSIPWLVEYVEQIFFSKTVIHTFMLKEPQRSRSTYRIRDVIFST